MKKITYLFPLFFAIALAVGFYLGKKNNSPFLSQKEDNNLEYSSKQKLFQVMDAIKNDFVDTISDEQLTDKTIQQLLSNLDPHSAYIPYKKNNREDEEMRGQFAGVGVKFIILNDSLFVTNVIANGPSFRAGLENGDIITKIDTTLVAGVNLQNDNVMKLLKGTPKTEVKIELKRRGEILTKTIIRGLIPIKSVTASYMLTEDIGYIKLVRFSETSSEEFFYAARDLLKKGMKKMVFDLRGNGGGYLQIAEDIVDQFLEEGELMVYTKDRNGEGEKAIATKKGILKTVELAVIMDGQSASASEIVAGAIQDNDRGTIYGRRSFGKGLVQKPIRLVDSSQMRITVARYYTPTGRCIQKPYKNGAHYDYMMELYDRDKNGELFALDSTVFVDSLKYTTPGGKVVYGGGGITPDIFIPFDTTGYSAYYRKVAYSRVITEFTINYLKTNRIRLTDKSLSHFMKNFVVTDRMYNDFVGFAKTRKVTGNPSDIAKSKTRLSNRIKEEIASGIWDEEGREYVNSRNDNDVDVVLKNM